MPTPLPLRVQVDNVLSLGRFRPQDAFTLRFNQPMDVDSTVHPLLFSSPIAGQFDWDKSHTRLSFLPDDGFTPGQTYTITLNERLKSADGHAFAETLQWDIQVLPAPQVVERPSTARRFHKERRPALDLTFDHAMDHESVAAALKVDPDVPLALSWQGYTLAVVPVQPLDPGVAYRFRLDRTAADSDGVHLSSPVRWTYELRNLVDFVSKPSKSNHNAPIAIHFNYAMDRDSVRDALIVEPATLGDLLWNEAGTVATFAPVAPLLSDTAYTVRFEGVLLDADGDALPLPDPFRFTTPPPILTTKPRGQDVHPATAIQVTFDRPMDEAGTAAALQISPDVTGSVEWRETTLVYQSESGYLDEHTSYTVTIDPTARDASGEPVLNKAYTWSFRTGELKNLASFGEGPNAQVLDAGGRRAVQFQLYQRAPASITFELYSLSLEQFLDRYASGFRGVAGHEKRPIPTEGTSLAARWQVETAEGSRRYGNVQEVHIPDDVPPGLYILNLVAGHLNDQLILLLTHHALVVKQAEGQLVAWATDVDGRPLPGIQVGGFGLDGTSIGSGPADGRGVYRTKVDRDPQPLIVIARDGNDVTASGLSNEWRSNYGWWGWWRPQPTALKYAAYVYTDRPIYRPGQPVFFKAIVRRDDDALLSSVPEGSPVTVRIRDARNNVVQTFALAANPFGTIHGEFQLAEGAMLGHYAVEIVVDNESHRQTFKVEDYRKPDYQVSVTTDAERYIEGEPIQVTVDSRYFFGEPVPNADLAIHQFALGQRDWWMEGEGDNVWYHGGQKPIQGKTDADGRFTFTLKARKDYGRNIAWRSNLEQSTWAIEATVDDGSHQTVSGFAVVRVFNAAEKMRLDTGGYAKEPGKPFTVRAEVVTIDDEPVSGRDLRLELRRYSRARGGYETVVQSADMTTDANGKAQIPFTIEEPGYYQLRLSGADRLGTELEYTSWIYAFSGLYTRWHGRDSDLSIGADRDSYAPGDVARLLIESTFGGPALLTFERGTTRREQLVELTAPLTLVEVPIQADDAPNIHIVVNAWQEQDTAITEHTYESMPDSQLRTASVNLSVPVTDKTLRVTITPDKMTYAPREEATFTVRVTDARGAPVLAEVSLAMVDEAIYALSEELAGPIFDAFYYERSNIVRTYNAMAPRRYLGGGRGGGGGGGDLAGNPRSDFPDTARWWPVLHTDADGEAVVSLTLPDSLTRWRLTAKAATVDTQVGETLINVVTRQEVVVRPILPRSLTASDRVELSAIVHNYGEGRQDISVSIAEMGDRSHLHIANPITQVFSLGPGELGTVRWRATVVRAGETQILVRADVGSETQDAVLLSLPIRPLAIPDVTSQVGQFSGEWSTTVHMPEGALERSGVKIELSRSIAGSLLRGLEFLTGFPYGCVEQTMSRALPNAVVGRALFQLGVTHPTLQADLPAKINAGLQRLYGYQHNDGGWGWWYDDSTDAYQTAWVVFGLAVTAEAGYEVDADVIERGAEWLAQNLDKMDVRTRAYALYSMATAGQGNLATTQKLAGQLDELDTFSRAALALALHELGATDEAQAVVDVLIETAVVDDGRVSWSGEKYDGHYHRKTMASATRSTALALSALVRIRPHHPLEPGIVRWLMGQRQQHGWGTTNETSFAILALTDHLLAAQEATTGTGYQVELNGNLVASGTLGPGEPAVSLEIPVGEMAAGPNALHIRQSGDGQLYYVVSSRVYLAQEQIDPAGQVQVSRAYLDARTGKPVAVVEPGQLVKVRLTVTMPDKGAYIIVEDNLPGGLEALNERLNTSSHVARQYEEPRYYWREYGYNHKEVHGDRVSFFITEMESGKRTFTYMARATHAGQFAALPAEVSAMYDLATWGRSASDELAIAAPRLE